MVNFSFVVLWCKLSDIRYHQSVFNFHLATWNLYLFHCKRPSPHQAMTILSLNVYTWVHGVTVGSFIGTLAVDTHPVAQGSIGKVEGFRWSFLSGINLPSYLKCFHLKTDTSVISNYCDQTICFVWAKSSGAVTSLSVLWSLKRFMEMCHI